MDAMCFVFNRDTISQAVRRGFDPRLPLLESIVCRCRLISDTPLLPLRKFARQKNPPLRINQCWLQRGLSDGKIAFWWRPAWARTAASQLVFWSKCAPVGAINTRDRNKHCKPWRPSQSSLQPTWTFDGNAVCRWRGSLPNRQRCTALHTLYRFGRSCRSASLGGPFTVPFRLLTGRWIHGTRKRSHLADWIREFAVVFGKGVFGIEVCIVVDRLKSKAVLNSRCQVSRGTTCIWTSTWTPADRRPGQCGHYRYPFAIWFLLRQQKTGHIALLNLVPGHRDLRGRS